MNAKYINVAKATSVANNSVKPISTTKVTKVTTHSNAAERKRR